MDGAEWGDSVLRCGWGKAVPIAARALYGKPWSYFSLIRPLTGRLRGSRTRTRIELSPPFFEEKTFFKIAVSISF